MTAKKRSFWSKLGEGLKEAGTVVAAISAAIVAGGAAIPFWVTSSPSLRAVIVVAVILGGLFGYLAAPYPWTRRKKRPEVYAAVGVAAFVLAVLLFTLVNPINTWVAWAHDFLITNPVFFNALMFCSVGVAFFCATSVVCLLAKKTS